MKRLIQNPLLKVLSLMLAVTLWFYVNFTAQDESVRSLPIRYSRPTEGLIVINNLVEMIELQVKGPPRLMKGFLAMKQTVRIDLSTIEKGDNEVQIQEKNFRIPTGINVLGFSPRYITVRADILWKKDKIPIRAIMIGAPAPGFVVEEVKVEPSATQIKVAKSEYANVKELWTEKIDLTGLTESEIRSVGLDLAGQHVELYGTFKAAVEIRIVEEIVTRTIEKLPVRVINYTRPVRLEPDHLQVTMKGTRNSISALDLQTADAWIDLSEIQPGVNKIRPSFKLKNLPEGTQLTFEPERIDVEIQEPTVEETDEGGTNGEGSESPPPGTEESRPEEGS